MNLTEAKILMDQIAQSVRKPSSWEQDFLESIAEHIQKSEPLSLTQSSKLQEVYRSCQASEYQSKEYV